MTESDDDNMGMYIGLAVGGTVLLGGAIAGMVMCCMKEKKKDVAPVNILYNPQMNASSTEMIPS